MEDRNILPRLSRNRLELSSFFSFLDFESSEELLFLEDDDDDDVLLDDAATVEKDFGIDVWDSIDGVVRGRVLHNVVVVV